MWSFVSKACFIACIFLITSCGKKTSLNTASFSDNARFIEKGYGQQKDIVPVENLAYMNPNKPTFPDATAYYRDEYQDEIGAWKENDKYMRSIAKVMQHGDRNLGADDMAERIPENNFYYIKNNATKGAQNPSAQRISNVFAAIEKNRHPHEVQIRQDDIDDYRIFSDNPQTRMAEVAQDDADYM